MIKRLSQLRTKKAESLVEVIMAIFVVALGSAVATSLIVSALQSNAFSRDNLIALNLAVEGIEAVRAVRDANWVKFSYDKAKCWNMRPEVSDCLASPDPIAEADGSATGYTVELDLAANKYSWGLPATAIPTKLDLSTVSSGNDDYLLYYYDTDASVNSDGEGGAADDHDLLASATSSGGTQTGASRFYRMVTVDYPGDDPSTDQEMDVVSKVQWYAQGVPHQVVLTSKLTNYQKVKVN